MKRILWLAVIVLLTLNACAPASPTPTVSPLDAAAAQPVSPVAAPLPSPTRAAAQKVTVASPTTMEGVPIIKDLEPRAIEDLAQRLGISATDITLISAEKDEFPGANFGCPDRQKLSTTESQVQPAFVVATEIVLDVPSHATRYVYRGKGNQLVFCFEKGY